MRAAAGGLIALVLLGLYAHLVYVGCTIVLCAAKAGCVAHTTAEFNDVKAQALSVIGGLVSALVIAELAITAPGQSPAGRVLSTDASDRAKNILRWLTGGYILVWLASGLAAFVVGLDAPNALPALTSVGQSWFGLAVAAAYAYFGLKPS